MHEPEFVDPTLLKCRVCGTPITAQEFQYSGNICTLCEGQEPEEEEG